MSSIASLRVFIDREKRIARFSGSGTFHARELIKQLGQARFNGVEKSWEVKNFELALEDLYTLFPGIDVEEGGPPPGGLVSGLVSGAVVTAGAMAGEIISSALPSEQLKSKLPSGVSVSQFLERSRLALRQAFPGTICIYGVLSEVDRGAGGRMFMELKESPTSDERVKCVIWQDADAKCAELKTAGFTLEPELQVMFEVSINLNKRGAQISLSIERIIVEYTLGKVAALREQTNERLKKEGLFDKNKALSLPFLPRRLGILTSAGGTVIHDFMASLDVAQFGFELYWMSVSVQGSEAKQSILKALKAIVRIPNLDAVLIFRGGGSQAELAIFNDYEIAKAVALSPLPVLSAIGHQEDQSSVQDISFRSFGVPKDLGRFFADIIINFRERFHKSAQFISTLAMKLLESSDERLRLFSRSLVPMTEQMLSAREERCRSLQAAFPLYAQGVFRASGEKMQRLLPPVAALGNNVTRASHAKLQLTMSKLEGNISRLLEQRVIRVDGYQELFASLGPEAQLKRGFAMVRRVEDGGYIKSAAELKKGQQIEVSFADSSKKAEILE